ncbi:uncharacterized protein LOC114304159 [Camellia sinensis]|uniref:uncharacterized protein LOC114304159 n=1 Tax=Camellia sinensis TaxID=4442 RepID=UPI0010356367|nr:uncharacterized protein LOC114304159 [Camellia sinensis]
MDGLSKPIIEHWKKLWEIWDVRVVILVSLFLQILLIFSAPLRKRMSSAFVTTPLWWAYLLADITANFAVGLISKSQWSTSGSETSPDLLAFWAPFLLVHLGGPDTITAFALEDNELWLRHFLGLGFQCWAVIYAFVQSYPFKELWRPTMLMFFAGLIKYTERTRSLYLASTRRFRDSLLTAPDPGPNYAKLMDEYTSKIKAKLPTRIEMLPEPNRVIKTESAGDRRLVRFGGGATCLWIFCNFQGADCRSDLQLAENSGNAAENNAENSGNAAENNAENSGNAAENNAENSGNAANAEGFNAKNSENAAQNNAKNSGNAANAEGFNAKNSENAAQNNAKNSGNAANAEGFNAKNSENAAQNNAKNSGNAANAEGFNAKNSENAAQNNAKNSGNAANAEGFNAKNSENAAQNNAKNSGNAANAEGFNAKNSENAAQNNAKNSGNAANAEGFNAKNSENAAQNNAKNSGNAANAEGFNAKNSENAAQNNAKNSGNAANAEGFNAKNSENAAQNNAKNSGNAANAEGFNAKNSENAAQNNAKNSGNAANAEGFNAKNSENAAQNNAKNSGNAANAEGFNAKNSENAAQNNAKNSGNAANAKGVNAKKSESAAKKKDYRELSKLLSNYMLYLLIMQATMMSTVAGIGQIRFRDTCAEAKKFFRGRKIKKDKKNLCLYKCFCGSESEHKQQNQTSPKAPTAQEQRGEETTCSCLNIFCCFKICCCKGDSVPDKVQKHACNSILGVDTAVKPVAVKGDRSKSVLFDASMLAKEMNKLGEEKKWEIMSKVWVELLSYAACRCRAITHASQLSKGGQLITLVWLLMAHFG